MDATTPGLLELQRAMRESLIGDPPQELLACIAHDGAEPAERLGIYRNTFASVLARALGLSFPAVKRLVGERFFEGTARIFMDGNPPRAVCLDDYGHDFPDFLEQFEPAGSIAYLPDVARLEWAVNRALHASDVPPLDLALTTNATALGNASISFTAHPALSLLHSAYPVDLIWRAVLDEDDAALRSLDLGRGPAWLLVERTAAGINVQRMAEASWRFTSMLCGGRPLHATLDEPADFDFSALLADHIASGRLVGIRSSTV